MSVRAPRLAALAAASLAFGASPAFAATAAGPSEAVFLAQIVALVVCGRLLGEALQRVGQPAVMGQLIAGILLGPSVFGSLAPHAQAMLFPPDPAQKAMINGVAQLGILLLLVLAGMETEIALVRRVGRQAASVSLGGIVVPFALGFGVGELLPDALLPDPQRRLATSVFLGTALSIASVKIVATVVREMGFLRRNIGQIIIASAIIDDTIGWVIIALTFGLAATARIEIGPLAVSLIGTAIFLVAAFTIGRRLVIATIRWTNDTFVTELPVISAIIALAGAFALATHGLGVHSVLGAFVAGVLIGESPILTERIERELRGLTQALFMPVFFGLAGLGTDLTVLGKTDILAMAIGFILIASLGKFAGAFLGGRFAGLSMKECLALGCGMNARGSTEVIVATIGLSLGVLDQRLFSIIVAMAVVTTMAMPPTLRWALRRLPLRDEERERMARADFEQSSFVARIERVLLAADASPGGSAAADVAGAFAGARQAPITIADLSEDRSAGAALAARVTDAARRAGAALEEPDEPHVETAESAATGAHLIVEQARKGFDLMVLGVEPATQSQGRFTQRLSALAASFEGSLAIVVARGAARPPGEGPLRMLVPASTTEASRRGAEFAVALAAGAGGEVAALHVAEANDRRRTRPFQIAERAEALRGELGAAAAHYGARVDTITLTDREAETAILRTAQRGSYDMIVMGVARRAGAELDLGSMAEALIERAPCTLVFFAPGLTSDHAAQRRPSG